MSEQIIQTGTQQNVVTVDLQQKDRWLISYGDDPDASLLWHEIRPMDEADRLALQAKLNVAGIKWDMLNLTCIERGEPWSIEQYIENEKDKRAAPPPASLRAEEEKK